MRGTPITLQVKGLPIKATSLIFSQIRSSSPKRQLQCHSQSDSAEARSSDEFRPKLPQPRATDRSCRTTHRLLLPCIACLFCRNGALRDVSTIFALAHAYKLPPIRINPYTATHTRKSTKLPKSSVLLLCCKYSGKCGSSE